MTEPTEVAERADLVVDGVWTWAVGNSNIGGATSSCQALAADGEVVLIDRCAWPTTPSKRCRARRRSC